MKLRAAKKRVADVADGALDAALLVAARDRHRARFIAIMPGKAEQGRMEADRIAAPFQHRALEIVVEQDTRDAVPRGRTRRRGRAGSSPSGRPRKKRRKIWREWLSTMTNAISGRRARPISRWPKCPQSTCACSPGRQRSRRYASACGRGRWQAIRWRK